MKKIDTHQHAFWIGRDDTGLVADMDMHHIEIAWLLSWEMLPSEYSPHFQEILNPLHILHNGIPVGIPLSDLLIAKTRFPDRFVLGFCPHPLLGNAVARLREAVKMYGVRVCGEWKCRMLIDDPRCIKLFRSAGELGLPVVLHLDTPWLPSNDGAAHYFEDWYGGTVENLRRTLKACPETIFIGHAPGFWREISGDADTCPNVYPQGPITYPGRLHRLLDEFSNLYADLSAGSGLKALERDSSHARIFLKNYSHKLLFGRDCYGGELNSFLEALELPEDVANAIYHQNAMKLLS